MIVLIDYGAGNTASVANALIALGAEFKISNREFELCNADKIIFPGVGEASFAMKKLHMYNLFNMLRIVKKPMLGICLGMQLMFEKSVEGNVAALGIFEGSTAGFNPAEGKVPHMGWNSIRKTGESKLFEGIKNGEYFYFAHSFYIPVNEYTTSVAGHSTDFSASVERDNYYGLQFHPEKSGEAGLKILKNFIELC